MSRTWIASFTQAMRRLGRQHGHVPHFFVEPCKEHRDCVRVQTYRREEHVSWKEEMATAAAQALARLAH